MSQFTKEYFIEKFSAIPEDKWTTTELTSPDDPDCHCALGHCGVTDYKEFPEEATALASLLKPLHKKNISVNAEIVYTINDGCTDVDYGNTPKERILKALSMVTAP